MKRLMNIIGHGALSTLDEAKIAAKKILQNVAKPSSKYIYLEDIERFMRDDKALKTMSLIKGGSESKKPISPEELGGKDGAPAILFV
ncbi:hypothetical protein SLA2020_157200 [Shorea laevis]